jgi:hypothetical protein
MAQPQVGRITCSLCNGWYNSESELRDHMQTAHRRFVSDQNTFQNDSTQQGSLENRPGASKEEWARLSAKLRDRVRARFSQQELDVIDRFILIASDGSVFDDGCR